MRPADCPGALVLRAMLATERCSVSAAAIHSREDSLQPPDLAAVPHEQFQQQKQGCEARCHASACPQLQALAASASTHTQTHLAQPLLPSAPRCSRAGSWHAAGVLPLLLSLATTLPSPQDPIVPHRTAPPAALARDRCAPGTASHCRSKTQIHDQHKQSKTCQRKRTALLRLPAFIPLIC